jgi:hypothetical protein
MNFYYTSYFWNVRTHKRTGKVLKDRFESNKTFDEFYAYYMTNFADYINDWLENQLGGHG